MDRLEKLRILTDAAKYDVACTSSGTQGRNIPGGVGSCAAQGICHTFSADGRCISLLKVLLSNDCAYDCRYCVNRRSAPTPRASFTPRELAQLTMDFYRRNYIEGLFLSSAVHGSPDETAEQMIETLHILRQEYRFAGYIHAKAIPGCDSRLIARLGLLCDRMSINIELPSQASLQLLAPQKSKAGILGPMGQIAGRIQENRRDLTLYRHAPAFAPAGQSTQMMVGATGESDLQILRLTQSLYQKYQLKRVFFSAYLPMVADEQLPALDTQPPLLREHRLYQADWLLRFYGFTAGEILEEDAPNLDPRLDPKCTWALRHLDQFPVEVTTAPYELLLRVPGLGVRSARRIVKTRRHCPLTFEGLKKLGVVLKRARYFITCRGKALESLAYAREPLEQALLLQRLREGPSPYQQLSLFDTPAQLPKEEQSLCLGPM